MCTGPNATGTCQHAVFPFNECIVLPDPFPKNINTFAPDGESFYCYPYPYTCNDPNEICRSPSGCTLGAVSFSYPHKYNLGEVNWNTYMKSFTCYDNSTHVE
jgi:hypothetical protein